LSLSNFKLSDESKGNDEELLDEDVVKEAEVCSHHAVARKEN